MTTLRTVSLLCAYALILAVVITVLWNSRNPPPR